ncbi:unnamed protein product [Clonostachys byssicola]|uniref:Uncharacterized protein n=1 Tax=Clonostachys byssicola TaxID=160290 RepID=A0A9N9Y863_9HYPO|nr:unnamed protein product [Clonostachys byssicola]
MIQAVEVSTVLIFATSIMGAAAQYGYSGSDLEQRDFELDQREIDLERREAKFKRAARAWLAARDAQEGLSPRSSPCPRPCAAGEYCDAVLKQCVPVGQPPHPVGPPPPPPQRGNHAKPKPKAVKKKAGKH